MSNAGRVAHIDPYVVGDSATGIAQAAMHGYGGIDLNARTCRANNWRPWAPWRRRVVLVHWSKWWEHGYEPKPGTKVPRKPIEKLRLHQVRNLRSIHGHHEVLTAEEGVELCRANLLIPCLELKPSSWPQRVLDNLHAYAVSLGWPVVTMTIQAYGHSARARRRWESKAWTRMLKAHDAGLHTMLLFRHRVDWNKWAPVLDAIKGHDGHGHVVTAAELLHQLRAQVKR